MSDTKAEYTDNGMRKCQEESCELPATHHVMWQEPTFYCLPHAQKMLMVGQAMGYMIPAQTFREMTPDEMLRPRKPKIEDAIEELEQAKAAQPNDAKKHLHKAMEIIKKIQEAAS